jgi:hypothetical protein
LQELRGSPDAGSYRADATSQQARFKPGGFLQTLIEIADRHPYGVANACLVIAWVVLSWPWLSGTVTIPYDAKGHFQAQLQFLANAIHSGQSPFWNPNTFVGTPHIADPQSLIFTPAYLIAYFDPRPELWKLDAYALGLLLLAGFAAIAMLRDRGWHPAACLLAAMAIAFGGSAAWRIQHIGQLQSFAIFIIALWLLERTLARSSKAWGLACGLVIGMMMASPNQVAFLAVYVLAGFVASHWLLGRRWSVVKSSLAPLTCAGLVAIAVAAVPLLLVVLYGSSSNRPVVAFASAVRGSLHPASLLTGVVGDLFGAQDPAVDYWGPYSERWDPRELTLSQNMSQIYIGALPVLLIVSIGLWRGLLFDRVARFWTVAAVALLVYALGGYTPLFKLMYDYIPGVAQFRRPVDATFLMCGMMGLLAAFVLHRLLTSVPSPMSTWRRRAMVLTVPTLLVVVLLVGWNERALAVAWLPAAKAALWLALAAGLVLGLRTGPLATPVVATLVIAGLMTADLSANNGPNESTALSPALYDMLDPQTQNPTVRLLKERIRHSDGSVWRDRVEVVGVGFSWQNAAMAQGWDQTLGYNPLRVSIVAKALGARDYIAGPDQRTFSPLFPSYRSKLANMLGLRFIVCPVPIEKVDTHLAPGDLSLVGATTEAFIYENKAALPRVLLANDAMPADFERLVRSGAWPAFDPSKTVLIDHNDPIWREHPVSGKELGEPANVVIRRYRNTEVDIDVTASRSGFVVLNDLWHPWWEATIDGKPARIFAANVLFRAVRISAGRHQIHFEFSPIKGALNEMIARISAWWHPSGRRRT